MSDSEEVSLLPEMSDFEDAGHPGNGWVPQEFLNKETLPSIRAKGTMEFCGTFFFLLFGSLLTNHVINAHLTVNNGSLSAVLSTSQNSTTGLNTTILTVLHPNVAFLDGANGLITVNESATDIPNPLANPWIAISWALVFFILQRALPNCAFNPGVTLNHFFFQWKLDGKPFDKLHWAYTCKEALTSVTCQFVAGFCAILVLLCIRRGDTTFPLLGDTYPGPELGADWEIIFYEMFASFLFMSFIHLLSRPRRQVSQEQQARFLSAGFWILYMGFIPYTSCSLNFVRTLSPVLVRSIFAGAAFPLYVVYYLVGHISGYFLSGLLFYFLQKEFPRLFHPIQKIPKLD